MRPLLRNLTIGLVVSLCIVGALGSTWWSATTRTTVDSLADHLPADAVLAYTEFPPGVPRESDVFADMLRPLPPLPQVKDDAVAAAAVLMPDGTIGWMTMRIDERGDSHIDGSEPSLAALLTDTRPPLSDDRTFRDLRFEKGAWTYLADIPEDSSLEGLLIPENAISFAWAEGMLTVRTAMRPTPSLPSWSGRPLASLSNPIHTILLPPSNTLPRLGGLLSPDTRLVIETVAATFLDSVARGLSLRYDIPVLLDKPSALQISVNQSGATIFSLEGRGENASETNRIIRLIHEKFASSNGGSRTKTVSAEGFSLTTLTPDIGAGTVETKDGTWTILQTDAADMTLISAHDGDRFAMTTDPSALLVQSGDDPTQRYDASSITWTEGLAAGLRPLWPELLPDGERLQVRLSNGPGYAEWAMGPLERL